MLILHVHLFRDFPLSVENEVIIVDQHTTQPSNSAATPPSDSIVDLDVTVDNKDCRDVTEPRNSSSLPVAEDYSTSQPSTSSKSPSLEIKNLDKLLSIFADKLTPKQIMTVYRLSSSSFDIAFDCLAEGPTLESMLKVHGSNYEDKRPMKVYIDSDDKWADMVAVYKTPGLDMTNPLKIVIDGIPAIDQGGVRRGIFTDVFINFSENAHVHLFEGLPNYLRPLYSAEAQSSGLFKVLGQMIAHSIAMDGVGFPYLSPVCYWYIVDGEDQAFQFIGEQDVGAGVYQLVTEVYMNVS